MFFCLQMLVERGRGGTACVAKRTRRGVLLVAPLATAHASLALGPKDPGVLAGNQLSLALRLKASSFGDVDGALLARHAGCPAGA